ncbi:MAG: Dna2/Cas4 domain-containing protein, partial [Synergistaceae bacterium]|nr:Dna2/Cas4 domain-containing protein [Synergistaceae bacterium]
MREVPLSIDSKVWTGSFLTGRPDAVIKKGPWVIPVEFKSANHGEPMESHRLQLLCYCLLLEEKGYKVPYGILRYREKKFKIRWNKRTKRYLTKIAK